MTVYSPVAFSSLTGVPLNALGTPQGLLAVQRQLDYFQNGQPLVPSVMAAIDALQGLLDGSSSISGYRTITELYQDAADPLASIGSSGIPVWDAAGNLPGSAGATQLGTSSGFGLAVAVALGLFALRGR